MLGRQAPGAVTFLCADAAEHAEWPSRLSPEATTEILTRYDSLLSDVVKRNGGTLLEGDTDGHVIAFGSARKALVAACELQLAFREADPVPQVRIALHTCELAPHETGSRSVAVGHCHHLRRSAHGGQILLSFVTGRLVQNGLPEGTSLRSLGEHRLKALGPVEGVFQLLHPDLPADFPPLRSLDGQPNNLPVQLTSFVGRDWEMAQVTQRLSRSRLVTLTGAGGSGKTRLALQVAADLVEAYPDGVWLVELAPIADAGRVPQAIAAALGLREGKGQVLMEALVAHLRSKHLLLVMDNCEHLVDACAVAVDALLRACPYLRILTTSRESLGMIGEVAWPVPPLSLPEAVSVRHPDALLKYEGIRLFVERAMAVVPSFAAEQEMPGIVQVCQRLDGMPLALELAAAQVRVLSIEAIARRLDDMFRLLVGGNRAALPRHQTLRAAVDWSYDLLSEPERLLWQRLAVFAGSLSLEAAEGVCTGDGIETAAVLPLMGQLVSKSLVLVDEVPGERRYRLLETIRQYGEERLRESGAEAPWRRRHLEWYLAHAEKAQSDLEGPDQAVLLEQMQHERDNVQVALRWAAKSGEAEAGLRLAIAYARLWEVRGRLTEGRRLLDDALRVAPRLTPRRAAALNRAASFAWLQGDYTEAAALSQEAMDIARAVEDWSSYGETLHWLGGVSMEQGEYARAQALFEEALALWRKVGDQPNYASALNNLGAVAGRQGDHDRAASLIGEALAMARTLGDWQLVAWILNNLGFVRRDRRDYQGAVAALEESLAIGRRLGDKRAIARSLQGQGLLAGLQGEYDQAAAQLRDGLRLDWEIGNKRGVVLALEGLARVAGMQGNLQRAARLFGGADRLRESMGLRELPVSRSHRDEAEKATQAVSAALGREAFSLAWEQGRALTVSQVVEFALEPVAPEPLPVEASMGITLPSPSPQVAQLSAREVEVVRLVVSGLTVREIANQLKISPNTVKKHEEHIRRKLQAPNRARLAAWAVRSGLGDL